MVGIWPEKVREPERTIVGEDTIDELVEGISGCKLPGPTLVLPSLPDLPLSLSRNLSLGRLQIRNPQNHVSKDKENITQEITSIISKKIGKQIYL